VIAGNARRRFPPSNLFFEEHVPMSDAPPPEPKKPILPPSRIAVLVFVVVGVIVIIFQWQAKSGWDSTYKAISAAIKEREDKGGLFQKDLAQYIHGSPAREEDKQTHTEVFTWKGIVQSYSFEVQYDQNGFVKAIRPR
jgi:hypothetical protein